jgi:hypothetical protein
MDKENVAHISNEVLLSHKEDKIMLFFKKMDRTEDHPMSKIRQVQSPKYHVFTHM